MDGEELSGKYGFAHNVDKLDCIDHPFVFLIKLDKKA